jgi:hypothetical protein
MRTCVATVHDNLTHACGKSATKCLRFLCVGNEPLINLVQSCDEHAKQFEKCDGFLGYTEEKLCTYGDKDHFCGDPAKWEMYVHEWMDDHEEDFFSSVCDKHRRVLKGNGGYAPAHPQAGLKVGDRAILPPHSRAILQETGREVLVNEDDTILGTQGDTTTAELLIGQTVVWVDNNTVKLKETS